MKVKDFLKVRERDLVRLKLDKADWLLRWEWSEEYHCFNSPKDLIRWFEWPRPYPHYFSKDKIKPLAKLSERKNRKILKALGQKEYRFQYVDEFNASDYLFQNCYSVPKRMRINRILDFGAGYGRQINLWSQLRPSLTYVGMDGIEGPYCLQHYYYRQFALPLREYIENPDTFTIEPSPGIYHLPTWRDDLLPDNFFDMVFCIQVLQEINEKLVTHMLKVFQRCLKPGGALFIRDHDLVWQPSHRLNLNELLPKQGFVLEFRPYVADSHYVLYREHNFPPDVHGIPRVWRKKDPRYPPTHPPVWSRPSIWSRINQGIVVLDRRCGKLGQGVYQTLRGGKLRTHFVKLKKKDKAQ